MKVNSRVAVGSYFEAIRAKAFAHSDDLFGATFFELCLWQAVSVEDCKCWDALFELG